MFDFLRDLGKSAAEKRQEQLNAYVDGELDPAEAAHFEAKLAEDPALRAEAAQLEAIKGSLAELPRLRAPRNYTLDPAVYGAPAPALSRGLPALRVATALAAFFFILVVSLDVLTLDGPPAFFRAGSEETVADVAVEEVAVEVEEAVAPPTRGLTAEAEAPLAEAVEMEQAAEDSAAQPATEETADSFAFDADTDEAVADEAEAEEESAAAAEMVEEASNVEEMEEADAAGEAAMAPSPPGTATDEVGARVMEQDELAETELRATEITGERDAEPPAEEGDEGVAPTGQGTRLPLLRVAQIVLGFLLAALLATWALARRE